MLTRSPLPLSLCTVQFRKHSSSRVISYPEQSYDYRADTMNYFCVYSGHQNKKKCSKCTISLPAVIISVTKLPSLSLSSVHPFHFADLAVLKKIPRRCCQASGSDKALPMAIPMTSSKSALNKLYCDGQKCIYPRSTPEF